MAGENSQEELLDFPSPDNFPSYDEVESEDGQAELPLDSFDESAVSDDEVDEACGCVR